MMVFMVASAPGGDANHWYTSAGAMFGEVRHSAVGVAPPSRARTPVDLRHPTVRLHRQNRTPLPNKRSPGTLTVQGASCLGVLRGATLDPLQSWPPGRGRRGFLTSWRSWVL